MKQAKPMPPALSALLTAALLSGTAYLTFIFPKTIATWQEEGRALSALAKAAVNASQICTSFGIVLLPLLLLTFLASVVWLIVAVKQSNT